MSAVPAFTTPEDLARSAGWSPRKVREIARGLGACRIIGNRMVLTPEDIAAILEASRPCPSLGRGVPLADILEALEKRKRQRNLAVKTLQVCVSLTRTTHERVSSSGTRLTQRNPSLFHPVRER